MRILGALILLAALASGCGPRGAAVGDKRCTPMRGLGPNAARSNDEWLDAYYKAHPDLPRTPRAHPQWQECKGDTVVAMVLDAGLEFQACATVTKVGAKTVDKYGDQQWVVSVRLGRTLKDNTGSSFHRDFRLGEELETTTSFVYSDAESKERCRGS